MDVFEVDGDVDWLGDPDDVTLELRLDEAVALCVFVCEGESL